MITKLLLTQGNQPNTINIEKYKNPHRYSPQLQNSYLSNFSGASHYTRFEPKAPKIVASEVLGEKKIINFLVTLKGIVKPYHP